MAKERKQLDRRWLWLGAAIILIIVFFAAKSLLRERLPVRAVQVGRQDLVKTIPTNGRVEPENYFQYYSPISTTVKKVYVQAGDKVPKGKLLIELDDSEARARLATADSAVKAAQAAMEAATHNGTQAEQQASTADVERDKLDLAQAQTDLDALVRLNSTGAASAGEVSAARQRLASAAAALHAASQSATSRYSPAEVARARAALSDAESSLAAAREVEEHTSYRAPIAGTVYSLQATETEFVPAGTLLLDIADLNHVRVRAYFDEPEIGQLAIGQKILIKWDARPAEQWKGHITRLPANVIHLDTRNVGEVLVALDDPDGGLLPDTNVTVTVTTFSEPNALSVSREALRFENGKYYVFRLEDDDRLEKIPVTIGTFTLTQVGILSGLKEGDWVATGTTNDQPLQVDVPIRKVQ